MTSYAVTHIPYVANDAGFRALITVISNAFATAWVQTSDTGQINLSTVLKPTGAQTMMGYQIWRMNDALQATAPCYVKMEYGAGWDTASLALGITIGTGSDGAGNITGSLVSPTNRITAGMYNSGNVTYTSRFSVDTNRICMYLFYGASYPMIIAIERTHNSAGGDTAAGVMFYGAFNWWNNTSPYYCPNFTMQPGIITSYYLTTTNHWNVYVPEWTTTSAWSTNVFTYPVRTFGQGESSPSTQICLYHNSDLTPQNLIPVTWWWGSTLSSMPIGPCPTTLAWGAAALNTGTMMRFD